MSNSSEMVFSTIHYMITFIFFFIILVNIVSLTIATLNMNVSSDDINAVTAKNLMIAAQVIAYVGELLILFFIGFAYSYSGKEETKAYYNKAMEYTGTNDVYVLIRVVSFSILMFISIIVSALCLAAAKEINLSDDPDQYTDQYNVCQDLGRMFFLHFVLFSSIQGGSYIYQLFYNNGAVKLDPSQLTTGKSDKQIDKINANNTDDSDDADQKRVTFDLALNTYD